ncbi:tetratricopeptide repeat protein [Streptomyces fulvoviolaceus]|uniref:tetratricopeptide repeat protein n=1 Tax=Streptomyces fulvoviolaceus TaxID=285535 RepID=UPI00131C5478|nr:tetratricopeptide repeat protein [Streptomyces fulvoviolaceus]
MSEQTRIHTIDGMAGVGKTALVTRAAHLLANRFPDGQFFVDLRAHAPGHTAAEPIDVLTTLLASLGVDPRSLPSTLEERSDLWRDQLADRRILLVLDDAADIDQIEPLLPGEAGCLTLVTSRRRLVALDGGEPLELHTLSKDEAFTLFQRLAHRAPSARALEASESTAVDSMVQLCGCLPLAIVVLAGRLAHRPTWTAAHLAADFTATTDRLGRLVAGARAVDAAFTLSYRDLSPARQRLFRRLALHPGPDIDPDAAAALDGTTGAEARAGLDALYTDHLLQEISPRRYCLHNLLREFANDRCTAQDSTDDRDCALTRLYEHYQNTITAAEAVVSARGSGSPTMPDERSALTWLRAQRGNILACLDQAAALGRTQQVISLTAALAPFLLREGPWPQAAALHERAAHEARRQGDALAEAAAVNELGHLRYVSGDYTAAIGFHERALALFSELGDQRGGARALYGLGLACGKADQYQAAVKFHERALALFEELGDRRGQARALHGLAGVHYMTADYAASSALSGRALALLEQLRDRREQSNTLLSLGFVQYMTGNYAQATRFHERALAICEDLGDRHGQALALQDLGRVRYVTGDYQGAADLHQRALTLFENLGDRHGQANGLNNLGRVRHVMGDYQGAADLHQRALTLFEDLGDRHGQANGLNNLGRVRYATAHLTEAAALHERALAMFEEIGHRHGRANALHDLGRVRAATGEHAEAADLYETALHLFQEIGDPQGEAQVWNSTGALCNKTQNPPDGLTAHHKALEIAQRTRSPLDEACALEGAARSHILLGDVDAAMTALRQAVRIYDRIGASATDPAARQPSP